MALVIELWAPGVRTHISSSWHSVPREAPRSCALHYLRFCASCCHESKEIHATLECDISPN